MLLGEGQGREGMAWNLFVEGFCYSWNIIRIMPLLLLFIVLVNADKVVTGWWVAEE